MATIYHVFRNKLFPPQPSTESFLGRTVLITATSSGLGLEGAKKLAALDASTLIITARDEQKCSVVKKQIEDFLNSSQSSSRPQIIPMTLDMSSFAGVQSFVTELKSKVQHLDDVILNAGTLQTTYVRTKDGWEETVQVNALSTLLLATLLVPFLLASPNTTLSPNQRPHLNLVSSTYVRLLKFEAMDPILSSEKPIEKLCEQSSFPPGLLGGQQQYSRSKLILEYGMRHLATSAALKDDTGSPKIVLTTCCPGMCQSDLGRQYRSNLILSWAAWIGMTIFARTSEQGCNTYITALRQGTELHGETWKDDEKFFQGPLVNEEKGKLYGDKVWRELQEILVKADGNTKTFLMA